MLRARQILRLVSSGGSQPASRAAAAQPDSLLTFRSSHATGRSIRDVNDQEAYDFYADPANREIKGSGHRRRAPRLTSMTAVRFAPEVIEAVKDVAHAEQLTASSWIRRLVQRELDRRPAQRPTGLIPGSGRAGEPRSLPSVTRGGSGGPGRTFSCPHMSIGNVVSASCGECGPMRAAS
jgi:hypothetical protein